MRLTRAAFAVMVKFSDMSENLQSIIDEIDMILTTEPTTTEASLRE